MADNVTLPGTGDLVAADDVAVNGGSIAKVQYVKLVDGTANGTAGLPGDGTDGLLVNLVNSYRTFIFFRLDKLPYSTDCNW
jgi:hypothetical protein